MKLIGMLLGLMVFGSAVGEGPRNWWAEQDKSEKLRWSMIGSAAVVGVYGLTTWEYGDRSAHWQSEGWFEADTDSGGADKLGHIWTTYTLTHGLAALYESWGYDNHRAARYGALASVGIMSFMEIGDAFSDYGFSPEDFATNVVGGLAGYYLRRNPELARKLDFRIEHSLRETNGDLVTDYENLRFVAAVKLEGFDAIESPLLQHLELHFGYYTRGYFFHANPNKERVAYVGLGVNLSKIFRERGWLRTGSMLRYVQLPFTAVRADYSLDD